MSLLIPSQVVRGNHLRSSTNSLLDDKIADQILDVLTKSSEYKGDRIEEKPTHIFRVGVVNIHGIPKTPSHPKNTNIKETINNYNFNFIRLTESNCYWPVASTQNT